MAPCRCFGAHGRAGKSEPEGQLKRVVEIGSHLGVRVCDRPELHHTGEGCLVLALDLRLRLQRGACRIAAARTRWTRSKMVSAASVVMPGVSCITTSTEAGLWRKVNDGANESMPRT